MSKFRLGKTVATRGVMDHLKENGKDQVDLAPYLLRHQSGDWGNIAKDDIGLNEEALENGGRLMSVYDLDGKTLWVITEHDRSVTTIMFREEY